MKRPVIYLLLLFSFTTLAACGGEAEEGCGFDISSISNGPDQSFSANRWECINSETLTFFEIFDNGTGHVRLCETVVIDGVVTFMCKNTFFTWIETGCGSFSYSGHLDGTVFGGNVTNIDGSISSGEITFLENGQDAFCWVAE